jgi:hypothetical protein
MADRHPIFAEASAILASIAVEVRNRVIVVVGIDWVAKYLRVARKKIDEG